MSLVEKWEQKSLRSRFGFLDMFGKSVNFGIKGQKKMTSLAGILMSCAVMILFASFFAVRTIKLV